MTAFLTDLGVTTSAIWVAPRSRTTRQNAQQVAKWAAGLPVRPRLLLDDFGNAYARAVLEFRGAGLAVVPAATDYEARTLAPGAERKSIPDLDYHQVLLSKLGVALQMSTSRND